MGRTILGEVEHLLMVGVVRLGDGAYGAAVIDEVERLTGRELSQAGCYISLQRLEQKGLLAVREADGGPERGGRPRKYFSLTDDGRARLRESAGALFSIWRGVELDPGSGGRG